MLCTFLRADRGFWRLTLVGVLTCAACEDSKDPVGDAGTSQGDAGSDDAAPDGGSVEEECKLNPPEGCPTPLTFADIEPILKARCIGCHDGKGEQWPLITYRQVADWYDHVRDLMLACEMPPKDSGIRMPAAEREKLISWVRCGYKE